MPGDSRSCRLPNSRLCPVHLTTRTYSALVTAEQEFHERVRGAVESIRGEALPVEWPTNALPPGTRVRIIQDSDRDGPWQEVFTGIVTDIGAPELVVHEMAHHGELMYWIDFDSPQQDADGDGPYLGAQIWGRYIEAL